MHFTLYTYTGTLWYTYTGTLWYTYRHPVPPLLTSHLLPPDTCSH